MVFGDSPEGVGGEGKRGVKAVPRACISGDQVDDVLEWKDESVWRWWWGALWGFACSLSQLAGNSSGLRLERIPWDLFGGTWKTFENVLSLLQLRLTKPIYSKRSTEDPIKVKSRLISVLLLFWECFFFFACVCFIWLAFKIKETEMKSY